MSGIKYAGAVGMLLILACGPQVEIGHGGEDGSAGSGQAGAQPGAGGEDSNGEGGVGAENIAGTGASAGSTVGGGAGGSIPTDNGPQAEVDKVDLLLAIDNSISM